MTRSEIISRWNSILTRDNQIIDTVKLVYKDHFICRFNIMERTLLETYNMWSLWAGGLYIQVVFTVGLTVFNFLPHHSWSWRGIHPGTSPERCIPAIRPGSGYHRYRSDCGHSNVVPTACTARNDRPQHSRNIGSRLRLFPHNKHRIWSVSLKGQVK